MRPQSLSLTFIFFLCSGHAAVLSPRIAVPFRNSSTSSLVFPSSGHASLTPIPTFLAATGSLLASVGSTNNSSPANDRCWISWDSYWKETDSIESQLTTFPTVFTVVNPEVLVTYTTVQITTTITEGNGNFATRTQVLVTDADEPVYSTAHTSTHYTRTVAGWVSPTITPPPCALPTYVPQCQSSWLEWVGSGAIDGIRPPCTQANVTGAACNNALSSWLAQQRNDNGEISGKVGLQWLPQTANGTTLWPSSTTLYYWPTSSAVAPGCTVGCQSCKISGSNVKLLYWPPATSTLRNGTFLTTRGPESPMTMITDGTTLTSPTVYISFDRLHASNSCKVIGQTLHNIIVPITNSATLSSLYGWDRYWGLQQTASFNFTDLYNIPVPESIYMSQPRCASSSINIWYYTCLPSGTTGGPICDAMRSNTWTCPRTLPYEPVISIPLEVRELQPEWSSCEGGVVGVYDPPSALHEAASVALPSVPTAVASTSAKTTQQSDPVPTIPAAPSPTTSSIPPPTQSAASPQQTQSEPQALPESSSIAQASTPSISDVATDGTASSTKQLSHPDPSSHSEQVVDPSPTNALEVLSSALSSFSTSEIASANRPASTTDPLALIGSAASNAQSATEPASVVFTANDQEFTVVKQSTGIVLIGETTTAALDPGFSSVIGSQTIVVESSGLAIADPSTSLLQLSAIEPEPPAAVWTASGATVSAIIQSSNIILIGKQSTATVESDDTVTFAGQTIQAAPSASNLVIDGSSISFTQPPLTTESPVWTPLPQPGLSAALQGSDIIIADPDTTITLPPNSATTLGSQTLAAASNALLVDGSPITLPSTTAQIWTDQNGHSLSAIIESNSIILLDQSNTLTIPGSNTVATLAGQTIRTSPSSSLNSLPVIATPTPPRTQNFSAEDIGSSVIIYGESTTLTVPDGSRTSLQGVEFSVPTTGGVVVVNNTTTVTAAFSTSSSDVAGSLTTTTTSKARRHAVQIWAVMIGIGLSSLLA